MKLAEALQERADLIQKINKLQYRLQNNCIVQEGEKPVEDPKLLFAELNDACARLEYLISAINLSNCTIKCGNKTLTEIIAQKDCLQKKVNIYRNVVDTASTISQRASRTEIKILSAVNVNKIQKEADKISKQIRELDTLLQSTNWKEDLIEK